LSKLQIMDQTGHSTLDFDPKDDASVKEAMEKFQELAGEGYQAAVRTGDGGLKKVKAFDPTATETVMHPQLVGG
jgi:hypothetical protein